MEPTPWQPPVVSVPTVEAPPPSRPGRSRAVVAGTVVGVVAVGLAGLFAVQRLGGGAAGGAASPEELGTGFLTSLESEDLLGVIDTLLPGERDSLGEPFVEMVSELRRLEVLSADADLGRLAGFDVEFTDERVDVDPTNVPDIANISLAADVAVTIDGSTLPLGSFIEDRLDDEQLTELRGSRSTETDRFEVELTAVENGGRWYFSIFHTVAELARADSGDPDIPDEGVVATGGDSPEAAVDLMLDAVESLDLTDLVAVLDPAEAAALQRYAPLFLDDGQNALDEVPLDWEVVEREFRVDGSGDERTVFIDAIGIEGDLDGSEFSVRFAEGCVELEADGESIEQCGTGADEGLDALADEAPELADFVDELRDAFADVEPIGLELRQRDGAWFVSPFATLTEAILTGMAALDAAELDSLVESGEGLLDDLGDVGDAVLGGGGDDVTESIDDGMTDDGMTDDGSASDDYFACYDEPIAADAAACFQQYVDLGDIDASYVPVALRYPECGIAELSWEYGYTELSDEEFTAVIEQAIPCFEAAVERGEITRWFLPYEILYLDCFEGRNWYAVYESEYNDRVNACIEATDVEG